MNQWHYVDAAGSQQGPVDDDQFNELVQSGAIVGTTLVWKTGMPEWVAYSTIQAGAATLPQAGSSNPYATPSQPSQVSPGMAKPDNYLVQAILATVFCCLPFGIVAIVFASQVDSKYAGGDYAGANEASENAKKWTNISVILGLVGVGLYLLLVVMGGIAGA